MSSQAENQLGFFGDIKEFAGTALLLCFLAQFCWIGTILREIISTLSFGRAVRKQKRGPKTLCILSSGEADAGDDIQNLERLQVTAILNQIATPRVWMAHVIIVIPKLIIAITFGFTDVVYLGFTTKVGDLLLNAMALALIIEIDDIVYPILVPKRLKTFKDDLSHCRIRSLKRVGSCGCR